MSEADANTDGQTDDHDGAATGADAGGQTTGGEAGSNADAGAAGQGEAGGPGAGGEGQGEGSAGESQGGDNWYAEDWREHMAKHASAGDQRAYERELARLQRFTSPELVYASTRSLENTFNQGGMIKLPGEDASEEEVAEYNKAMGVPDEADGYLDIVQMEEGLQIGEADVPNLNAFLDEAHANGIPPGHVESMLNWYFRTQADMAADIENMDDTFRSESDQALREEFGTKYSRLPNAIDMVYSMFSAGGGDASNPDSLAHRMAGARFPDGRLVSADADFRRMMVSIADDVKPGMTQVDDYGDDGRGLDTRLAELAEMRKTDKKQYYSEKVQSEEADLLARKARRDERGAA